MNKQKHWFGFLIRSATAIGISFTMASLIALAGSTSTTLPNGASLAVSIDDPVTSTEFIIPANDADGLINVNVTGTASIGLGEPDATFVYIVDVSGSTSIGGGIGCSPILGCEQIFIKNLNQAAINDGSVDEVGLVVYADSSATADMSPATGNQLIIAPDADNYLNTVVDSTFSSTGDGGVDDYTRREVGQFTNCEAGLQAALTIVNASTNGTKVVVFVSDGQCNRGGSVVDDRDNLVNAGAIVHSIATGSNSDCDEELGLIPGGGGECHEVPDPGNLPADIIPELIGSTLLSLEISVDGGAAQVVSNADILDCNLPTPGATACHYQTTVAGLGAGDHQICVTAKGTSVVSNEITPVTRCETIHLLQLTATPATETNELGSDNSHTVTATLLGDSAQVTGRKVNFAVTGQNPTLEADGTCNPADCKTNASGSVSFTYSVPVEFDSLGTDTITASSLIAGVMDSVSLEKIWRDTTPPVGQCIETTNPHGKNIPKAPGKGQNEDGFYQLLATDDLQPASDLQIFVEDTGSGMIFGPYMSGDKIKYTESNDETSVAKKMGSGKGQAGAIASHIIGNGDASVYAVDGSGNQSDAVSCLVPPKPK